MLCCQSNHDMVAEPSPLARPKTSKVVEHEPVQIVLETSTNNPVNKNVDNIDSSHIDNSDTDEEVVTPRLSIHSCLTVDRDLEDKPVNTSSSTLSYVSESSVEGPRYSPRENLLTLLNRPRHERRQLGRSQSYSSGPVEHNLFAGKPVFPISVRLMRDDRHSLLHTGSLDPPRVIKPMRQLAQRGMNTEHSPTLDRPHSDPDFLSMSPASSECSTPRWQQPMWIVCEKGTYAHELPRYDSKVIGSIERFEVLHQIDTNGGWVQHEGGWTPKTQDGEALIVPLQGTIWRVVWLFGLNARADMSLNSTILETMSYGRILVEFERSGDWIRHQYGWSRVRDDHRVHAIAVAVIPKTSPTIQPLFPPFAKAVVDDDDRELSTVSEEKDSPRRLHSHQFGHQPARPRPTILPPPKNRDLPKFKPPVPLLSISPHRPASLPSSETRPGQSDIANDSDTLVSSDSAVSQQSGLSSRASLSEATAVWVPDDASSDCMLCSRRFSLFVRRHHCRACGSLVCNPCSSQTRVLPQIHPFRPLRVCRSCAEDTLAPLTQT